MKMAALALGILFILRTCYSVIFMFYISIPFFPAFKCFDSPSLFSSSSDVIHLPEKVKGPFLESSVSQVSCGWKHTAAISGEFLSSQKRKKIYLTIEYFVLVKLI